MVKGKENGKEVGLKTFEDGNQELRLYTLDGKAVGDNVAYNGSLKFLGYVYDCDQCRHRLACLVLPHAERTFESK